MAYDDCRHQPSGLHSRLQKGEKARARGTCQLTFKNGPWRCVTWLHIGGQESRQTGAWRDENAPHTARHQGSSLWGSRTSPLLPCSLPPSAHSLPPGVSGQCVLPRALRPTCPELQRWGRTPGTTKFNPFISLMGKLRLRGSSVVFQRVVEAGSDPLGAAPSPSAPPPVPSGIPMEPPLNPQWVLVTTPYFSSHLPHHHVGRKCSPQMPTSPSWEIFVFFIANKHVSSTASISNHGKVCFLTGVGASGRSGGPFNQPPL